MKIFLNPNYVNKEVRLATIQAELTELEAKLLTPSRTVDDIVRHMQLVKERNALLY